MDYGNLRYDYGYACALAVVLVVIMQYGKKIAVRLLSRIGS